MQLSRKVSFRLFIIGDLNWAIINVIAESMTNEFFEFLLGIWHGIGSSPYSTCSRKSFPTTYIEALWILTVSRFLTFDDYYNPTRINDFFAQTYQVSQVDIFL